jgi:hypothetical protein
MTGCQPYAPATLYPHKDLPVLFSVEIPWAIERQEGLGQLKNVTSSGVEPHNASTI